MEERPTPYWVDIASIPARPAAAVRAGERLRRLFAIVTIGFALVGGLKAGEVSSARGWSERHWTTEDGLPQNSVEAIVQTGDGYLWFGTLFGLARFDGARFVVFDANNTPELVRDPINELTVDAKDGGLWIATPDGVLRYANARFERFGAERGFHGVWVLGPGRGGGVWCSRRSGEITRIRDGSVSSVRFANDAVTNHVRWIWEQSESVVFVGLMDRLVRLNLTSDGQGRPTDLFRPGMELFGFATDGQDRFWMTTAHGAGEWSEGEWHPLPAIGGEANYRGGMVRCLADGEVWVRLEELGLCRLEQSSRRLVPVAALAAARPRGATCAMRDREGNIWIGTRFGAFQLRAHRVQVISKADGLRSDEVVTVSEGSDGTVWLGTEEGVSWVRAGKVGNLDPPEKRRWRRVSDLIALRDGRIWLNEAFPCIWRDGVFERREWAAGVGGAGALFEDRDGRLWIGRDKSVGFQTGSAEKSYSEGEGLPPFRVRAIHQDRAGKMWIGSYGGGFCKLGEDGRITSFVSTNGELNNRVWAIHEDREGVFWLGTQAGLNRFENGRFFTFTTAHGLHENVVNHVIEDPYGYLWFGGLRGIYRVARHELNAVAAGRTNRVRCVALGQADGMLTPETNGERTPSACKTHDDRIWFPTGRGVVVVDPREIEQQERATPLPPVVIEQVRVDETIERGEGASPISEGPLKLAPGRARVLEIRYTANCFTAPERVRFRCRLQRLGEKGSWVEAGDRRVAYFTNLKPGDYEFQVTAADHHGRWNEVGAIFRLSLAPQVWQTWTFYGLCGVGFVGMAGAVQAYRLRVQRRILALQQEQALAEERARIARDLHDDLGSDLTGLALQLDVASGQAGKGGRPAPQLSELARRARGLVDNMREVIWAANPACDTLEGLAAFLGQHAEGFLSAAGLRCRLDFPPAFPARPVSAELRHQVFLVVKEALHNVVRHAGATEVTLHIEVVNSRLILVVEDNGCGRAGATSTGPVDSRNGHGLPSMRRRVARLGGEFSFTQEPGGGARIRVNIPILPRTAVAVTTRHPNP